MQQRLRIRCGILAVAVCAAAGMLLHYWPHGGSQLSAGAPSAQVTEVAPVEPETAAVAEAATLPSPDTSATDEELLTLARDIVSRSPQRAIDWARAQADATL